MEEPTIDSLIVFTNKLISSAEHPSISIPMLEQEEILVDRELLALYNVNAEEVNKAIEIALKGKPVTTLRSFNEYTPVEITGIGDKLSSILNSTFVPSQPDKDGNVTEIPLRSLVILSKGNALKTITANGAGEYVPLVLDVPGRERETIQKIRDAAIESQLFDVDFAGSFFSNAGLMKEMAIILVVSVLLMYFILCAQFGNFRQPLIVIMEIPIDTAFALISLLVFGQTLNIMSAIGIIVTCGIVVNDSILKLDAINELRKAGFPLIEAIHTAGRRRLRAIIMTSLTTIFAMVPVLFASDMGSELQRPLAIAMIGSMIAGTFVSVFIIPLFYWLIYRKDEKA